MEFFGYLGAVGAGLSLGLIGGGGSILLMPILIYLFHINPELATTYSLFVVGAASVVGAYQYHRSREIEYKIGLKFLVPSILGVLVSRRLILPYLPEELFQIGGLPIGKSFLILMIFATLMLTVSLTMIFRRAKRVEKLAEQSQSSVNFIIKSFLVGVLTGFVGAGGGFLIIPALVMLGGLPMRTAVGTSLFIISVNSLIGFLSDAGIFPELNWNFLLTVTAATTVGIFAGKSLSNRIPNQRLEPAFGWFVLVVGIYIVGKQVMAVFA